MGGGCAASVVALWPCRIAVSADEEMSLSITSAEQLNKARVRVLCACWVRAVSCLYRGVGWRCSTRKQRGGSMSTGGAMLPAGSDLEREEAGRNVCRTRSGRLHERVHTRHKSSEWPLPSTYSMHRMPSLYCSPLAQQRLLRAACVLRLHRGLLRPRLCLSSYTSTNAANVGTNLHAHGYDRASESVGQHSSVLLLLFAISTSPLRFAYLPIIVGSVP